LIKRGRNIGASALVTALILVVAIVATPSLVTGQSEGADLAQLRHRLALQYLEPAPHIALAKYFWARGDRLQAFYLLEYARRFPVKQFDLAFAKGFGGLQGRDQKGLAVFNKGVELQRAGNLKEAEEHFIRAAELGPRSVHIQSWVGRFFFKVKRDDKRALNYYLNAYFLDPHAYESEFVESRIRSINYEAATVRHTWLVANRTPLAEILQDPNPTVVVVALMPLAGAWSAEYLTPVIKCMEHDDEQVRWLAVETISKNVNRSFDSVLKTMLSDVDLRKRGLAAYIAARLWKHESYPILQQMLREPAHLLRFDAISALAIDDSSAARRILREYRRFESHPTLLELIDKVPAR
jgi:hypothetical protein